MSTAPSRLENVAEKIAKHRPPQSAGQASGGTFDADGRRVIRHDAGRLPEVLDELGAALAEYAGNLFSYTNRIVMLYPASDLPGKGVSRPRGALILHTVESVLPV